MNSTTTDQFWRRYSTLPSEAKRQAREAYTLFVSDPYHPSLHFKRIHLTRPVFSVRIGIHCRAVGVLDARGFGSGPTPITTVWSGNSGRVEVAE